MTDKYETRVTEMTVLRKGDTLCGDSATIVGIDDEGGGEFVVIRQPAYTGSELRLNPDEWPAFRDAIHQMVAECRPVTNGGDDK